jgi:hypothetical protein
VAFGNRKKIGGGNRAAQVKSKKMPLSPPHVSNDLEFGPPRWKPATSHLPSMQVSLEINNFLLMILEQSVNSELTMETEVLRENLLSTTLPITNPAWSDTGSNPGRIC